MPASAKPSRRGLGITGSALVALCLAGYTGAVFTTGAIAQKRGFVGTVLKPGLQLGYHLPINATRGWLLGRPERLGIEIAPEDLQILEAARQRALQQGVLTEEEQQEVPALLRTQAGEMRAKLRLKGDWLEHLRGKKWSFRVQAKGDHVFHGMKRFSLQHPKTRNYLFEWVFHRLLAREGVLSLQYAFIDVSLNGRPLGVYALEEHFGKELIERARLREAPILKFDEGLLWDSYRQFSKISTIPFGATAEGDLPTSRIDVFSPNKTRTDPALSEQFRLAAALLEGWRRRELPASQAFDTETLGTFLALTDLLGASHATNWHNVRFYYNPLTSHLEPVGFDADAGHPIDTLVGAGVRAAGGTETGPEPSASFPAALFEDHQIWAAYAQALWRFSDPAYLNRVERDLRADLAHQLDILHREFPYYQFSLGVVRGNQRFIREALSPIEGLRAHVVAPAEPSPRLTAVTLDVGNLQSVPLEAVGLVLPDGRTVAFPQPVWLEGRPATSRVKFLRVTLELPHGMALTDGWEQEARLRYRIAGLEAQREAPLQTDPAFDAERLAADVLRRHAPLSAFPFLAVDAPRQLISVKPGRWVLKQPLVIPRGYTMRVAPATRFDLQEKAMVVSYGALEWLGEEGAPVEVTSSDGTGQGLVLLQASASRFEHVTFSHLHAPSLAGWELTGAVTVYETPVVFRACRFLDGAAEDTVNVVRSSFRIEGCEFARTQSDALDVDFGEGVVVGSRFHETGNDAIDVSGTLVQVRECTMEHIGDKGISVGEESALTGSQLRVDGARIGIASKDRSRATVDRVALAHCQIGLSAYQKKPVFGPARITVTGLTTDHLEQSLLVERGSMVVIDGVPHAGNETGVDRRIYGE